MQVTYRNPNEIQLIVKNVSTTEAKQYINIVTAPKCGTHLILNILYQFGIKFKFLNRCPHITLTGICNATHLKTDEKYIGITRDPRDFLLSYLQWIDSAKDRQPSDEYLGIDMDTKLDWAINGTTPSRFQSLTDFPGHTKALYDLKDLSKDSSLSNLLILSFEDLIGPELGGNSSQTQLNCLKKVLTFTGTIASDDKIKEVSKTMIGSTVTYTDKKKVGRWRDYFKDHHIKDFKLKHNPLLVALGYEINENWDNSTEPVSTHP